ncbi:hypothetical protein ACDY97_19390, partial [Rhizobium mongolense]|uniref:hypothetical protein n=1 Tax=Rhizobium mongolense TaxID=57676 RepID=UPI003558DFE4
QGITANSDCHLNSDSAFNGRWHICFLSEACGLAISGRRPLCAVPFGPFKPGLTVPQSGHTYCAKGMRTDPAKFFAGEGLATAGIELDRDETGNGLAKKHR